MAILSTPRKEKPTKGGQAGAGFKTTFNVAILADLTFGVKAALSETRLRAYRIDGQHLLEQGDNHG